VIGKVIHDQSKRMAGFVNNRISGRGDRQRLA